MDPCMLSDLGPELSLSLLSPVALCPRATQGFTGSDSEVDYPGDRTNVQRLTQQTGEPVTELRTRVIYSLLHGGYQYQFLMYWLIRLKEHEQWHFKVLKIRIVSVENNAIFDHMHCNESDNIFKISCCDIITLLTKYLNFNSICNCWLRQPDFKYFYIHILIP